MFGGYPEIVNGHKRFSLADTLLKYAGTWAGDDLEDCLKIALHSRGEARF